MLSVHRPVERLNTTLNETPFRLIQQNAEWNKGVPKRVGVSAFGFGGNNAHLVMDAWTESTFVPAEQSPLLAQICSLRSL